MSPTASSRRPRLPLGSLCPISLTLPSSTGHLDLGCWQEPASAAAAAGHSCLLQPLPLIFLELCWTILLVVSKRKLSTYVLGRHLEFPIGPGDFRGVLACYSTHISGISLKHTVCVCSWKMKAILTPSLISVKSRVILEEFYSYFWS